MTNLGIVAREKGSAEVTITFRDTNSNLITPNTATWSLFDSRGLVVNSRSQVAISGLASSKTILLSGLDLAITSESGGERVFVVEYTYNSTLGTNIPDKDYARFSIENVPGIL